MAWPAQAPSTARGRHLVGCQKEKAMASVAAISRAHSSSRSRPSSTCPSSGAATRRSATRAAAAASAPVFCARRRRRRREGLRPRSREGGKRRLGGDLAQAMEDGEGQAGMIYLEVQGVQCAEEGAMGQRGGTSGEMMTSSQKGECIEPGRDRLRVSRRTLPPWRQRGCLPGLCCSSRPAARPPPPCFRCLDQRFRRHGAPSGFRSRAAVERSLSAP